MDPLYQAIKNNNMNQLKLLLDLGYDPNAKMNTLPLESSTPLEMAFDRNNKKCIALLLQAGANPSRVMQKAIEKSNEKWLEILLNHGVAHDLLNFSSYLYVLNKFKENVSCLHLVARNNQVKLLEVFMKFGADVNCKSYKGYTPAFYTLIGNSMNVLERLISYGCNLTETDLEGCSLMHHAAIHNATWAIPIFLEKGLDINHRDYKGRTPLFYAIEKNAYEAADLLLKNNADHALHDPKGRSAAMSLARDTASDNTRMIEILNQHKVSFQGRDYKNQSLMVYLFKARKASLIDYLLKSGYMPQDDECINNVPLISYAMKNHRFRHESIISYLEYGFHIHLTDSEGNTPLITAAQCKKKVIGQALLSHNVNVNACNNKGLNALQYTIQHNDMDFFLELFRHPDLDYTLTGDEIDKIVWACVQQNKATALDFLLQKHPEFIHSIHPWLLCDAIIKNRPDIARILINAGTDVNYVTDQVATALMYAANRNLAELVQLLIESGADVNFRNDWHITPLIEASRNQSNESAALLLAHGADIHMTDRDGYSALDYAREKNNQFMIREIQSTDKLRKMGISA